MDERNEIRAEFDLDPSLIYLNAANQSLLPRIVRDAIFHHQSEYERNPTAGMNAAWGRLWKIQGRLARFLGADRFDLFLRTNITSVLNTFILGLPLPPGSEILVGELEYGAIVNICRLRASRENLSLRVLKMPSTPVSLHRTTRDSLVDGIISQLGPKTRMVVLSHVLGGVGLVMPLKEITSELRARGVFSVIDGAYAPGALVIDMTELSDVDCYACSLYKWLLGPKGTAFGWVSKESQPLLSPVNAGWSTFDTFAPFKAFGESHRFQESFLMVGCHDFAPFFAIDEMLDFWDRLGPARIRERMAELQQGLRENGARLTGWIPLRPGTEELTGPLLAYILPASVQRQGDRFATRALEEAGVQVNTVWLRGKWCVVFSPHIHNSDAEVRLALERLTTLR